MKEVKVLSGRHSKPFLASQSKVLADVPRDALNYENRLKCTVYLKGINNLFELHGSR
jgi:hypothetical protein